MMRPRRERNCRWRLAHKLPIHINFRPHRIRSDRDVPRLPRRVLFPQFRPMRMDRPHPTHTRFPCHRHGLQLQFVMVRPQQIIFPMMFSGNADPIERPIRQRNFAQYVPILRHPQHHAMFQPRAEHHMGLVKISARIIHPKRRRAHHRPIDLHCRPSRRTRHAKRLRPRQRRHRRKRRDQRRHPNHPPPASPVRHHQQPPRGKPAHCHRNVKPSMRTNTHAPRKSPSNYPQTRNCRAYNESPIASPTANRHSPRPRRIEHRSIGVFGFRCHPACPHEG